MTISGKTAEDLDNATEDENLRKLEAIFFVSGRFLTMPELISLSDLNPVILKDCWVQNQH